MEKEDSKILETFVLGNDLFNLIIKILEVLKNVKEK